MDFRSANIWSIGLPCLARPATILKLPSDAGEIKPRELISIVDVTQEEEATSQDRGESDKLTTLQEIGQWSV
ncbi:hypothetical protein RRG08_038678 [Elysia crispata]|uniref:Uncharacterized protein n=1 Tax=Elysia crispata TaxID=231223 RepID=A0AAE0ZJA1_9GAST|nr:hypothetical protein RRG08_038678 [Elysia crispata]